MSYVALANITLGSSASSVTFSSIPTTGFRDLVIVLDGSNSAENFVVARVNGDTGTNYGYVVMTGSTSAISTSGTYNVMYLTDNFPKINSRYMVQLSIMDYSATDKHKTALARTAAQTVLMPAETQAVYASAHRWANTAAITSVVLFPVSGNFNSGTTAALYGIRS